MVLQLFSNCEKKSKGTLHTRRAFSCSVSHINYLGIGYNPPPVINCPQHRWQSCLNSIKIPKLKGKKQTNPPKPQRLCFHSLLQWEVSKTNYSFPQILILLACPTNSPSQKLDSGKGYQEVCPRQTFVLLSASLF